MAYDFRPFDEKLTHAREWLAREYKGLRTGRATPAILDSVTVSAYGSLSPIKQVANVAVEDARTLRITPWDASVIKEIEKGVTNANLGVGIIADGTGIRITFPELTGERRAELVKMAKHKLEEARTTVRVARDEVWKHIQEEEREGNMSEDEKFRLKDEMQKKVDDTNDALEKTFEAKEQEMNS